MLESHITDGNRLLLAWLRHRLGSGPTPPPPANWDAVPALLEAHRVLPLFYNHAPFRDSLPAALAAELAARQQGVVRHQLCQQAELVRLHEAAGAAQLDWALFKGAALGVQLYPDPLQRSGRDIDLLVPPEQLESAIALLLGLGYQCKEALPPPPLPATQHRLLVRSAQELEFYHPGLGTTLEPHWRLGPLEGHFPVFDTVQWRQLPEIELQGRRFKTLPEELNFVYLCCHGGLHHWMRLHWLVDIALYLQQDRLDWVAVWQLAGRLGARRAVLLACAVVDRQLSIEAPAPLRPTTPQPWLGPMLAQVCNVQSKLPRAIQAYPPAYIWARLRWVYRLFERPRERYYHLRELMLPNHRDYHFLALPAALASAYWLLKPLRLLYRHLWVGKG